VRAATLLGYLELDGDTVALTGAGRDLAHNRGFFTWGVGGYSTVLRNMADLARGDKVFGREVTRDGDRIAAGSGITGRAMMLPVEAEVLAGLEFSSVADLGCGDGTRLIRLCGADDARRGLGIDVDRGACELAVKQLAEAGLAGRAEIVCEDVIEHIGRHAFPGVELVTSFLMMHDLFEAMGDPGKVMRLLREVFPDARRFLIGDTVSQEWDRPMDALPIFSLEFELVHAFMDTPIMSRGDYEEAFKAADLRIERSEPLGVPSTRLWLLAAN
jgi:SAM-dependent methyltransferase